ncbi:MAG: fluoride efflux transporter CrcB [Muribaculaceae bacterium]|nr:fluoride efflux transporter CrcB [Muribaculaceae bacterium]
MWKLLLLAGAGGFVGTCCRFLVNRLFLVIWNAPFPIATFTINVVGCFIFGVLSGILGRNDIIPAQFNALLLVGFCGGFTTFSTFSNEALNLGINGDTLISFFYIAGSVIVGLFAVWFGLAITR